MKRLILAGVLALFSTGVLAGEGLIKKASTYSVGETIDRLEKVVKGKGFTVFARVDHAAGAKRAGLKLRPTQLLIFGNPKVGTKLMSAQQTMGIDLPVKVLAYEDENGQVWIAYNDPAWLVNRHRVNNRGKVVAKMTGALKKFTDAASGN